MNTDKSPPSGVLEEDLLDDEQAAQALRVQKQTMAAWRQRGNGPAYVKIGKLIKYRPSDLRAYVASRVVRPQGGTDVGGARLSVHQRAATNLPAGRRGGCVCCSASANR
jgi:hypothetical protein